MQRRGKFLSRLFFLIQSWPEILLILITLFFTFRELRTFPSGWADSGLYNMIARSLSNGHGYALPLLKDYWHYPFFVSVGPPVVLPAAFFTHFFGIARLSSAMYILAMSSVFFLYVKKISGRNDARWATALLVTLSAFINTGKPVLGSVPALFYFFVAVCVLRHWKPSWVTGLVAGGLLGLAILSKLTFVLTIPALLVAMFVRENAKDALWRPALLIAAQITSTLFLLWLLIEIGHHSGFIPFLAEIFVRSNTGGWSLEFAQRASLLLRFQYIYFLLIAIFGSTGLWMNTRITRQEKIFFATIIFLFFVHFLVRENWYRHLILAHVLLLPFVPQGFRAILPRKSVIPLMLFFVVAQFLWQLDHRGSSLSTAAQETAGMIEKQFPERDLLIQHPEVFVRLPENPHWLYYPIPGTIELIPPDLLKLTPEEKCFAVVRKIENGDSEEFAGRMQQLRGGYYLFEPPASCKKKQ